VIIVFYLAGLGILYWIIRNALRAGVRDGMKDHRMWPDGQD